MSNEQTMSIFNQLNTPFPYSEYKYDSFGDRCYISGQSVTERLNEVLGVGFWQYHGLYDTEKIIQDQNGKNPRVKIYVEFSFYNVELKEWINFIDVGSEQIKPGMHEGDATKSAITDGMKKCASRLGVGSDVYKGLILWDKQQQKMIVPDNYQSYYEQQGWVSTSPTSVSKSTPNKETTNNSNKSTLTDKLKTRPSTIQKQMKQAWQQLAGSLDGFEEWAEKKQTERVTEQQMLLMLQNKMNEKNNTKSA